MNAQQINSISEKEQYLLKCIDACRDTIRFNSTVIDGNHTGDGPRGMFLAKLEDGSKLWIRAHDGKLIETIRNTDLPPSYQIETREIDHRSAVSKYELRECCENIYQTTAAGANREADGLRRFKEWAAA